MVTHELESIFRIADRCLMLDKDTRSVIAVGDPRELRESGDPRVHDFFNPRIQRKEAAMAAPANYVKIGLFVSLGIVAAVAVAAVLGTMICTGIRLPTSPISTNR